MVRVSKAARRAVCAVAAESASSYTIPRIRTRTRKATSECSADADAREMEPLKRDETMRLSDAKVSLNRKAIRCVGINQDWDRMVVQEFRGDEDTGLI